MSKSHIHIAGICGTFMGGLAQLAKAYGYDVSGCDQNIYPPMSDQLAQAGIELMQGYKPEHIKNCNQGKGADMVVIGNALSRGNPLVEEVLNRGLDYTSGPQWLADNILHDRWVLAVAGTHGKTTTSSILAWILEAAGLSPGYLIGGVPANFGVSARLGQAPFFVIEADEYDTAFFDKRSKFIHYRPRTLILNNLEFDHADIFENLAAIQKQFHHLLRTVPEVGRILINASDIHLAEMLEQGCWSEQETFGLRSSNAQWQVESKADEHFELELEGKTYSGQWSMPGEHNLLNATAAIAAARHVGVSPKEAVSALLGFKGIKRRLEVYGEVNSITVYDDFAHHPTAIVATLAALRKKLGKSANIYAVVELRSNTMRMGIHNRVLADAMRDASHAWIYQQQDMPEIELNGQSSISIHADTQDIILDLQRQAVPGDHIIVMSNGGFDGLHDKLLKALTPSGS